MSKEQVITGHRLEVVVEEAREIKATNFFSSTESDAFCELNVLDGVIKKTEVQFKTLTPTWNEKFTFELSAIPEGEVLFVNVWGRHVVAKNTFIGRVEIPLSLIIEPLIIESDTVSYKESATVSRWFKLLPTAGSTAWDQCPGFVRLTLQYKYVPEVVPTRAVPSKSEINLATQQPPNTTLCFQCPVCSQLFMPEVIMSHMQSCATAAPQQQHQVFASSQQVTQPSVYQVQPQQQIVIPQQSQQQKQEQQQQQQQQQQQLFQSQQVLPSAPQYSPAVPPPQQQKQGYPYISTVGVQVYPPSNSIRVQQDQTQQQQQQQQVAPALPSSSPPYLNQNYLTQPMMSNSTSYMMMMPPPPPPPVSGSSSCGVQQENYQYYTSPIVSTAGTMVGAQ